MEGFEFLASMKFDSMDSEAEALEEKLTSLLGQLQAESAILERMVYKNKNQHRRGSYFQYLMKVRRDLKLLQSTKLEEILGCCFQSITGKRPKQKVHLLESLKRRKCESGKYNFMERLLGAVRLLSQMVEPMLKAAVEISTLLAQSFFMGFSLTILALLARLRVLVQQILLDVVSVFNMVSSLSQKKQSVKINQGGLEVFREFYPTNEEFIILECVLKSDKFELLESTHKSEIASHDGDLAVGASSVLYQSVESFLGDDENIPQTAEANRTIEKVLIHVTEDKMASRFKHCGDGSNIAETPSKKLSEEGCLLPGSSSPSSSDASKLRSRPVKVAFVQVKRPLPSTTNTTEIHFKETDINSHNEEEDPLFSLLSSGNGVYTFDMEKRAIQVDTFCVHGSPDGYITGIRGNVQCNSEEDLEKNETVLEKQEMIKEKCYLRFPTLPFIPKQPYDVIATDYDNFALVSGAKNRSFIQIYSRTPNPGPEFIEKYKFYLTQAKSRTLHKTVSQ